VARACAATGSVYLVAVGGAAAYLGGFVAQSRLIAWEDLGTEALRCLTLTGLPAYVGIDSRGKTLDHFSTAQQASILPDRLGTPSQASTPAAHFSPTAAHGTSHSITPERRIT
jgi:hypothetical protein